MGLGILLMAGERVGGAAQEKVPEPGNVEVVGDQLEYERGTKKMIARGNVVVSYGEAKLAADYAEVDTQTKKAYAKGHVILIDGERMTAQGEEAHYDFGKHEGVFPDGRSVSAPWFVRGKEVRQLEKGKFSIDDAGITTCDLHDPHFQIRAKKATVHTGDKIVARDITFHILGKKVFWLPYAVIPLQDIPESPVQLQPGYSSQDGAYLLTSKGFSLTDWLWGKWHLDYRAKRGLASGIDFGYYLDSPFRSTGGIQTYLTQDHEAPRPGQANPYADREERLRGRVSWRHRSDFNPNTYLLLRFNRLADEFFLQDFFEREFRSEVEPESFVTLTHNTERYGAYVFNQARINDFEDTTERLPEIRFDWKSAPFLSERNFYESNTSLANLNEKVGRSPVDFHVFRFDTFHEWARPMHRGKVQITPLLNLRETLYSRDETEAESRQRTAFGGGLDVRTHYYRVFDTTSDFLGIEVNQLRHVFEPSVRYDGTWHSSVSNEKLHEFDTVDTVDDADRIKFGLENRVQTKRVINGRMQRVDLVSLNTFVNYDFHPDEEFSRSGLSTLEGELQLRPYEWLQFEIRTEYDMVRDRFLEFNQDLLIRKGKLRLLFGHRSVPSRKFLNAEGNNQFVFDASYWVNERWRIGGYVRLDQERHELQEWELSATRDLHDFLLDFGYNVRNSEIDNSNKELFFVFRLKAFPGFPLKSGNRASFAEPRIGTTVAGANAVQPRYYQPTEA